MYVTFSSSVCPIHFCLSVQRFLSCRRSNTIRWPNAGLILAYCLRRWPNISSVLSYRVVFGVTLNVDKRHRRWANINPALFQSIVFGTASTKYWLGLDELPSTGDAGPTTNRQCVVVGLYLSPAVTTSIPARNPENTKRWTSTGLMLVHRQRHVSAGSVDKPHCVSHQNGIINSA